MVISLVPLLLNKLGNENDQSVWKNSSNSSSLFCRPIFIEFAKETSEKILACKDMIEEEIKNLKETILNYERKIISVKHNLIMTMIDEKVKTFSNYMCIYFMISLSMNFI